MAWEDKVGIGVAGRAPGGKRGVLMRGWAGMSVLAAAVVFACWASGRAGAANREAGEVRGEGKNHYAAPNGKPSATGTKADPWDLASVLGGKQKVAPGDTVWVRGGVHTTQDPKKPTFGVQLSGTKEKPVHVRAYRDERAIVDGGMLVQGGGDYLWLEGLEITVSPGKDINRETKTRGSSPGDLGVPTGGVTIQSGKGAKFINLYIHRNPGGAVGWWTGATDGEMYGCIMVDNGWKAPDRNHGHCVYTQNKDGVKTLSNCIMSTPYGGGQYTVHAYGSAKADCDNFVIEENICYNRGQFLVGSGRTSHNIRVLRNYLYNVPMQIGYNAPYNEDCEVRENVIAGGGLAVSKYNRATVEKNLVVRGGLSTPGSKEVTNKDNTVRSANPDEAARVVLLPNKYDKDRANLAIYNWRKEKDVTVKVKGFLKPGERYVLRDPEDLYGKPAAQGRCAGDSIKVPVKGEFAAFVLMKADLGRVTQ